MAETYSLSNCGSPNALSAGLSPSEAGGMWVRSGTLVGKRMVTISIEGYKVSSPVGDIAIQQINKAADTVVKATSSTVQASTLTTNTTYGDHTTSVYTFDPPVTIAADDCFIVTLLSNSGSGKIRFWTSNSTCDSGYTAVMESEPPGNFNEQSGYTMRGQCTYEGASGSGTRLPPPPLIARF